MSRVTTTNYGAASSTQFAWATAGSDLFNREQDLYRLAQAVENHTHAPTRGLAIQVGGIADSAVTTAALAALAVTNAKMAASSVGTTNLIDASVTYSKFSWPIVQSANNTTGAFSMTNIAGSYYFTMYVATNGLVVLGATIAAGSNSNITLGPSGDVTIGGALGAGFFSILQRATAIGSGLRIYSTNTAIWHDFYVDGSGYLVHTTSGSADIWIASGRMSIGAGNTPGGRISINQALGGSSEGFYLQSGLLTGYMYLDAGGHLAITGPSTGVLAMNGLACFAPATDNTTWLGHPGIRWSVLYAVVGTFYGAVTIATTLAVTGLITSTAGISGGPHSGTTAAFSSTMTVGGTLGVTGVATFTAVPVFSGGLGAISVTSFTLVGTSSINGEFNPYTNLGSSLGSATMLWGAIYANTAFKPGGGSWAATSDKRTKVLSSIRPYDRGLETLRDIKPVYYTQNGDYGTIKGAEFVGVVADDVEDLVPEMVFTQKIKKTERSRKEDDIKTWDGSNLIYMAVLAINELADRMERIEAQLKERKN